MKDFKWNIVYAFQVFTIVIISCALCYKMGIFSDIKNELIPEVIAEDSLEENQENLTQTAVILEEENKEEIEETQKEIIEKKEEIPTFEKISQEEVNVIIEKYKDQTKKTYTTTFTSYNSEPGQTDDTPCITASNLDVCERDFEDIVATNDLPFHTKILIPEYFGERIFYVEDRMNKRYTGTGRIDIWMRNKTNSKNWGIRQAKVIVLK